MTRAEATKIQWNKRILGLDARRGREGTLRELETPSSSSSRFGDWGHLAD